MASIAFISDKNNIFYTKVSMVSVIKNWNTKKDLDLYCLFVGEVQEDYFADLKSILSSNMNLNVLPTSFIKEAKHQSYFDNICYLKFLIPEMIKSDDAILYLDSDTITTGDLSSLFDLDMGDYVIGAVEKNLENPYKRFGVGVLLINSDNYRKGNWFKILCDDIKDNHINADKYILNKNFNNHFFKLKPNYNLSSCDYDVEKKSTTIIHFWGCEKPWNSTVFRAEIWKKYAELLEKDDEI